MTRLTTKLGLLIPIVAACGGTAIVDDPIGGGGAGGASDSTNDSVAVGATGTSGSATTGGSGSVSTGVAASSTGSVAPAGSTGSGEPSQCGPKPATCTDACLALWCCSFSTGFCPNLDANDEKGFVSGCMDACQQTAAIIGLVDPADCGSTVKTIAGINGDFAMVCFGGG